MLPSGLQGFRARLVGLAERGSRGQAVGRDGGSQRGLSARLLVPRKEISVAILLITILRGCGTVEIPLYCIMEMRDWEAVLRAGAGAGAGGCRCLPARLALAWMQRW